MRGEISLQYRYLTCTPLLGPPPGKRLCDVVECSHLVMWNPMARTQSCCVSQIRLCTLYTHWPSSIQNLTMPRKSSEVVSPTITEVHMNERLRENIACMRIWTSLIIPAEPCCARDSSASLLRTWVDATGVCKCPKVITWLALFRIY